MLLTATSASPAGWSGFYARDAARAAATAPEAVAVAPEGACLRAILDAQARHGIPDDLLLAIGLQEAGTRRDGRLTVWPWSVNAAGEGRRFDTRAAAEAWVRARRAAGVRSIDVGCLQVNLRWHPDAFPTPEAGFDPARNADYAARFLRDLHRRTGDWTTAAASYHSFTPGPRARYAAALARNRRLAATERDALRALAGSQPPSVAATAPRPPRAGWSGRGGLYARN
nr:lytic transglycosylase domain-containing protein [Jannaschia sp. Os4]